MNKEIKYNREENLFQAYLSRMITSVFEAGLVEREKRFMPHIIEQELRDIVNDIRNQERERIIEEINKLKVISPNVEPPKNRLSQNQIFIAGQMNVFMRLEDIIKDIK